MSGGHPEVDRARVCGDLSRSNTSVTLQFLDAQSSALGDKGGGPAVAEEPGEGVHFSKEQAAKPRFFHTLTGGGPLAPSVSEDKLHCFQ